MNIIDIITKKKNKGVLSYNEIKYAVDGFLSLEVKDYQMSSLLMAIAINSMSDEEIFNLTKIMLDSGDKIDLSSIDGIKVDKHSTGGVGDKTTLVVAPLVASCGVPIAKMSGRGLGFTGGTIDKLESIKNFKTSITNEEFIKQVNNIGIAIVSQSGNLVPADKKIYALRDVTGTTESIPLIASSIMSKKIASGADKIVLDVKVGRGAFMKNIEDARKLSEIMIKIGKNFGKEVVALITNMDYPLGNTIGNALEVKEAIDTLNGKGEERFTRFCLIISAYMISIGKQIPIEDALDMATEKLNNKEGLNKFNELVKAQGGDINNIEMSNNKLELKSKKSGYITDINPVKLAKFANLLGAGRSKKEDIINHKVGIILNKKVNDEVKIDDTLLYVFCDNDIDIDELYDAFTISENNIDEVRIIYDIIR
ncbi:MAG: thymidine phosphorylase [Bacilli bacterium]|nr:thymidine phosphorylase [Bacilli bacterium]